MNQRLRELVEQAITEVDVVYEDNPLNEELAKMYIPDCFAEKFAELVVRECTSVVDNLEGSDYIPWVNAAIKKHFGVEE